MSERSLARAEKAKALFEKGYNCAQAVFVSFCDRTAMTENEAAKLASSFGGGMGRLREVCGAFSGLCLTLSALYGYDDPEAKEAKAEQFKDIQGLAAKFREENGSIVCRELLGLKEKVSDPTPEIRTSQYYHKRPCGELVACAARLLEEYIEEREK